MSAVALQLDVKPEIRRESFVYKPELDALRFFAFLAVFFSHIVQYKFEYLVSRGIPEPIAKTFLNFVGAGGSGVDLFFLLSAYLITDLLLREKAGRGSLNVPAFYIRRALRIWPLYFVVISSVLIFPILDLYGSNLREPHYIFPFLLLSGNWAFVIFGAPHSVLSPLWSVSVEEQFYLLWPPIVSKLSRRNILIAAGIMVAMANADRLVEIVTLHHSAGKMWGNTFAHLDSLAVGIAIAVVLNGYVPHLRSVSRLLLVLGASLSIGLCAYVPPFLSYILVVIACSLVFFAFLGSPLNWSVLRYLGKISYGLYVYHIMAIDVIDRIYIGDKSVAHAVVRIVLSFLATVAVSALSYTVLEKPFLQLKKRFTFVHSRTA